MRLISFLHLKQNCRHFERDYDFDKDKCRSVGHDSQEVFAVDPETKEKYYYCPCKEKYCPVLQGCRQILAGKKQ